MWRYINSHEYSSFFVASTAAYGGQLNALSEDGNKKGAKREDNS